MKRASGGDAQEVTVHGKPTTGAVSAEEYARLTRRRGKLSAALQRPKLGAEDLDLSRSRDTGRNTELRVGGWTQDRATVDELCTKGIV